MDELEPDELKPEELKKPQIHDYSHINYIIKSLTTSAIALDGIDVLQFIQSHKNDIIKSETKLLELEERIKALEGK